MGRTIVISSLAMAGLLALVLPAQDKPGPQILPFRPNSESKQVLLVNQEFEMKDAKFNKQFEVDTAGYSEARFIVSISARAEPRVLGKTTKLSNLVSAVLMGGGFGQIANPIRTLSNMPSCWEVITVKVHSNKTLIQVALFDLESAKIAVNVEVYLVK